MASALFWAALATLYLVNRQGVASIVLTGLSLSFVFLGDGVRIRTLQWEREVEELREAEMVRNARHSNPRTAKERAQNLLLSHLDPKQTEEFVKTGGFHVTGANGHLYHITNTKLHYNVTDKTSDYPHCVVARDRQTPIEDVMLAQKLMVESNPRLLSHISYRG